MITTTCGQKRPDNTNTIALRMYFIISRTRVKKQTPVRPFSAQPTAQSPYCLIEEGPQRGPHWRPIPFGLLMQMLWSEDSSNHCRSVLALKIITITKPGNPFQASNVEPHFGRSRKDFVGFSEGLSRLEFGKNIQGS